MMNVLYVCLAITLFQGIQGFEGVDYQFKDGEVEVSPHFFELMAAETQLLRGNQYCDNVSYDLQQMYGLGVEVTKWLTQTVNILADDVHLFYNCSGPKVFQCVSQTFEKTKEDLEMLKPAFDEYKQRLTFLVKRLRKELPLCLY